MEQLVTRQREITLVAALGLEGPAIDLVGHAVTMLEAAAAPVGQVEDDRIVRVGQPAEEIALGLDDAPRIGQKTGLVLVAVAPDRQLVGDTVHSEGE
jgi:hypothetical protein